MSAQPSTGPGTEPGRARGNNAEHPWVQPIVVAKTGHHQDTVLCAAQASVGVWFQSHDSSPFPLANYEAWLAGPFTKTVRRASMNQLASLVQWATDQRIPYADAAVRDSAAIAFPPMRYEEMPREIARFQVRGTDFGWRTLPATSGGCTPIPRTAPSSTPTMPRSP